MNKITFGVLNPHTKEIIIIATTLFGGILWLNELAQIFSNDTPVVIIEGESDVTNIGDLRTLETKLNPFIL